MQLAALVATALDALTDCGTATLADVGSDWMMVGRAVHRAWLDRGGRGPLLALDADHIRDVDTVRAAARALGMGLLHLGPGVRAPTSLPVPVLRHAGPTEAMEGIDARLDAMSVVASDPSLERARAAVTAYARANEVVYLRGPVGAGRASLARWAAATLGAPSLVEIGPDTPAHPSPGAWLLVRELEDLPPDALGPLRARLLPPPRVWGGTTGVRPDHPAVAGILGEDRAFCEVLAKAIRHARGTAPVLILGESGSGKEPLAKLVHDASGRQGPFVAIDLASRPANLLEDDLFGHEVGAFEGARQRRAGAFRQAHGGTLFLDELGNLPPRAQERLLRVLETGRVQPLGRDWADSVDVRVVAATNADLEGMVRAGAFRRDLYHRLEGATLRLPPLRERGEDAVRLAEHFARAAGKELAADAQAAIRAASWPGNVRQLKNLIRAAADEARGPIRADHLGLGRNGPIFVTGSVDVLDQPGALSRREAQALAALTIHVPAPAERGEGCLRNAVFSGLGGRPTTPEAVARLVSAPWWGNFVELDRKLRTLRGGPPGAVDLAAVAAVLPDASGREPLISLLAPSVREDGQVHGWRATHHDEALVIGRARSAGELDDARRRWISVRADAPGFLAFPHLPELSRAHALVSRRGDGLQVMVAPAVGLPLRAGPLDGPLLPVEEGASVALGAAAELRVTRDGEPLLQLFLFVGDAALEEATPLLRARLGGEVGETQGGQRVRSGPLEPEEMADLVAQVVDFVPSDRDFAPFMREALQISPHPGLRALVPSTNLTQAVVRTFFRAEHEWLRQELVRRLRAQGLLARARERFPTRLAAILPEG